MFIAPLGRISRGDSTIYFETSGYRSMCLPANDPSNDFMELLRSRSGQEVREDDLQNPEFFKFLVELKFITPQVDEKACRISQVFDKFVGVDRSISLHLLLTQFCNLGCVYCYNGTDSYQLRNKLKLSVEHGLNALRLFYRYVQKNGHVSINLLGGEPLLNWQTAHEILARHHEIAAECGFAGTTAFSIQTNLTFIPPGFIEDARRHDVDIIVEVDGDREVHDTLRPHKTIGTSSFEMTKRNCSVLTENGVSFRCKGVITSHNISDLDDLTKTHSELGAERSSFGIVRPVDSDYLKFPTDILPTAAQMNEAVRLSKERGGHFYEDLRQSVIRRIGDYRSCGTVGCHYKHAAIFTVTSDGSIYNCPWFVGAEDSYIGSVSDDRVSKSRAMKNVETVGLDLNEECLRCDYYSACGGGCPVTERLCKDDEQLVSSVRQLQCSQVIPVVHDILFEKHGGSGSD
ncbi:radical SAM protein [Pseudoroseicyclus sp. H15]